MSMGLMLRCCCLPAMLAMSACKHAPPPPPPKPLVTKLEIVASADINPDSQGRASPLVTRFFQLRTDAEFAGAPYFQLYDHEKEVLGASLISRDEFPLAPAAHILQEIPVSPDARFLGVSAAYRDSAAVWRAVVPVPPKNAKHASNEQHVTVRLNKTAVALTIE
jgi:type VI secretion system protein VasD